MSNFSNPTKEQISKAMEALGASVPSSFSKVEALEMLGTCVEAMLLLAKNDDVKSLCAKVEKTGNAKLIMLSDALKHKVLRIKPANEKLGYDIEEIYKTIKSIPTNHSEQVLLEKVLSLLDLCEYIFSHTHYDECSNGFFFRRS